MVYYEFALRINQHTLHKIEKSVVFELDPDQFDVVLLLLDATCIPIGKFYNLPLFYVHTWHEDDNFLMFMKDVRYDNKKLYVETETPVMFETAEELINIIKEWM